MLNDERAVTQEVIDVADKAIKKTRKPRKTIFRTYKDAVAYQKANGRYPVVQKVKPLQKDPREDVFELVRDFKTLKEARDWLTDESAVERDKNFRLVRTRLNYLIWYDPTVEMP